MATPRELPRSPHDVTERTTSLGGSHCPPPASDLKDEPGETSSFRGYAARTLDSDTAFVKGGHVLRFGA